ncbi:MAG: hypothetical protein CM15mP2_0630 [Methanobacteriota archaeon]|nr:MAG: hypothetical protein CM15mP2_0630 [Euryarchaeota archaeon]
MPPNQIRSVNIAGGLPDRDGDGFSDPQICFLILDEWAVSPRGGLATMVTVP